MDKEPVEDLTRKLKRNRVQVIAHNFLGKPARKEAKQMVDEVGGKTLEVVPGKQ